MGKLFDIDIDFANREEALACVPHVPATIIKNKETIKHNTGVYFYDTPLVDPMTGYSSIDYRDANARGYMKVDFLNVFIYSKIKDEEHLERMLNQEPVWEILQEDDIVSGAKTGEPIFQLQGQIELLKKMKPKNIDQLAMLLALIRPGKKHLIDKSWDEIEKSIWEPIQIGSDEEEAQYGFKKSHAYGYASLVIVQMNLILEQFN